MSKIKILFPLFAMFALVAGCTDYEDAQATAERVYAIEQQLALENETAIDTTQNWDFDVPSEDIDQSTIDSSISYTGQTKADHRYWERDVSWGGYRSYNTKYLHCDDLRHSQGWDTGHCCDIEGCVSQEASQDLSFGSGGSFSRHCDDLRNNQSLSGHCCDEWGCITRENGVETRGSDAETTQLSDGWGPMNW